MKAFIRFGVGFFVLVASLALRAGTKVEVEARPELRLAIVDSNHNVASRDALHKAFTTCFAAAINKGGGATIEVKSHCVSADLAAFGLRNGNYDAVLAIVGALPRPLIMGQSGRLEATLNSGKKARKAYLIFNTFDEGLAKALTAAFLPALTNDTFMDALDGGLDPMTAANAGTKIAAGP